MKLALVAILGSLALTAAAGRVSADNTTCAGATLLVPDGSLQEGALSAGASARWFRFVAKAGRSYALMLENLTPGDEQPEIGVTGIFSACGGPLVPANDFADIQEPASIEPSYTVGATRQALRVTADAVLFFPVLDLNVSNTARFRIRVEETTLYNPLWRTDGGVETYYRLFNTTNRPCTLTLDLRTDSNGIPNGPASAVTFTLGANSSVTRRTGPSDLSLQAGQIGHATLAHDCTAGAILAEGFLISASRELPVTIATARQQR